MSHTFFVTNCVLLIGFDIVSLGFGICAKYQLLNLTASYFLIIGHLLLQLTSYFSLYQIFAGPSFSFPFLLV